MTNNPGKRKNVTMPWRNDEGFVIIGVKYFLPDPDCPEF